VKLFLCPNYVNVLCACQSYYGHLRDSDIARLQASPYISCFDFCFFSLLLLLAGKKFCSALLRTTKEVEFVVLLLNASQVEDFSTSFCFLLLHFTLLLFLVNRQVFFYMSTDCLLLYDLPKLAYYTCSSKF
jgi:hypothetical protein